MAALFEVVERLTEQEKREVRDFAEFLLRKRTALVQPPLPAKLEHKISFDRWAGCMAHIEPGKADKQLVHEAWDDVASKYGK